MPRAARTRRRSVGGVRARRGAPAHGQPRDLQGAALPRRRRVRARRRLARDRPARRAPAPHAVDRRRVPRRSDGDRRAAAAERLRVRVADAAGAACTSRLRRRRDGRRRRARARRARGDCGARAVLLREGRRARAARSAAARGSRSTRVEAPLGDAGALSSFSRSPASSSASRPGCCSARWSGSRPGRRPSRPGTRAAPARHRLAAHAGTRARARRADRRARCCCAARGAPRPAPTWACGQLVEPALRWTSAGFTKPLRLVLEAVLRPRTRGHGASEGGIVQGVDVSAGSSPPDRRARLPAGRSRSRSPPPAHARRLQSGSLGTYVAYLVALVLVLLAAARWA